MMCFYVENNYLKIGENYFIDDYSIEVVQVDDKKPCFTIKRRG